jgi:hypothetical protein
MFVRFLVKQLTLAAIFTTIWRVASVVLLEMAMKATMVCVLYVHIIQGICTGRRYLLRGLRGSSLKMTNLCLYLEWRMIMRA